MSWRTFVQAHWPALATADFFTRKYGPRGLVTYYTLHPFALELQSRRVQMIGCTPYPNEAFVIQCLRHVTGETSGLHREGRILLCDRDATWSHGVERWLGTGGSDAAARAELQRLCGAVRPVGEGRMLGSDRAAWRTALASNTPEFVTHYHPERNHQGLANELIDGHLGQRTTGPVRRRQRVG